MNLKGSEDRYKETKKTRIIRVLINREIERQADNIERVYSP